VISSSLGNRASSFALGASILPVDEPRVASGLAQPQQCLEHVHPDLRDAHAVDLLEKAVTV
jgi:hypothetical protein